MVTICRFGDEHGFGHVTRSAALNLCARTIGWNTELCTTSDPSILTSEQFHSFSKITKFGDLDTILGSISELDIVLIDDMYESDFFFHKARLMVDRFPDAKLVAMDDMKVRSMEATHLVINAELGLVEAGYGAEKSLLGERYALLRSGFSSAYSKKRTPASGLAKVFIMIGGTDPDGWTGRVLDSLERFNCVQFAPLVVSGDGRNSESITRSLSRFSNSGYEIGLSSAEIASCISDCHFGIIGCGSSVYELAAMKCRFIGICVADNQKDMAMKIETLWGLPVVCCDQKSSFSSNLDGALKDLLDQLKRDNGVLDWEVDCLGTQRVMDEIGRL